MDIKRFIKDNYKVLIFILIISAVPGVLLKKSMGIKDAGMFSLATVVLIFEIYYAFIDVKKSILFFIISFPILVTARKIFYFDILFLKFTYEAIYIQFIFIYKFKSIIGFLKNILSNKKSLGAKFIMLVLIFAIFALNANIFSNEIMKSFGFAYIGILIPIMFLLIVTALFKFEEVDKIIFALIFSLDLSCFYGFSQVITKGIAFNMIKSRRNFITFGYHNINIFAGILITVFPMLVDKILYKEKTKKQKMFLYTSLLIYLVALFITYSRGAWISALFAIFLILISKKYKKLVYAFTALIVVGSPWIVPFILHRGKINAQFFSNVSIVARVQSIFTSIPMMFKFPFGTGGGTFAAMYNEYAIKGYLLMPKHYRIRIPIASYPLEMAHNLWLQIGVEFGIICAVVFLIIFINRIKAVFKNYSLNRGIFVSIIVYAMFAVTTGTQFNHKGVITGTLILWLIFALVSLNNKEGITDEEAY